VNVKDLYDVEFAKATLGTLNNAQAIDWLSISQVKVEYEVAALKLF
jgi:hypothetical protein